MVLKFGPFENPLFSQKASFVLQHVTFVLEHIYYFVLKHALCTKALGNQQNSEMRAARKHWRSPLGKGTKVTARRRLWGTPHEGLVRGLPRGINVGWY